MFGKCSHGMVKTLFRELINKAFSCFAVWKCKITEGSKIENIRNEDESQLKSAGCVREPQVKLGLEERENKKEKEVYWVDEDENSSTCRYGAA